jgi:hypothetical protein
MGNVHLVVDRTTSRTLRASKRGPDGYASAQPQLTFADAQPAG